MSPTTSITQPAHSLRLPRLLLTAALAAAVNLGIYGIASASGTSLEMASGPIPAFVPPLLTFFVIAFAGVLTWAIGRKSDVLARVAPWVGGVVAAATALAPILIIGVEPADS